MTLIRNETILFVILRLCLVIVFLFTMFICSIGQPFGSAAPGYRVKKLEYKNSTGEVATTRFLYDCDGFLVRGFWSVKDGSRSSVNDYIHDHYGNLVSAYREFSDGVTSLESFSFNKMGHKIEEQFSRSDGVKGVATYHFEGNKLVSAHFKKHKGWLVGQATYHYDKKSRRIRAELMQGDQVIGQVQYKYDSCDNLVTETWEFGGQWSQDFRYSYDKLEGLKLYYSSPLLSPLSLYRISGENYTFNY